MEGPRCDFWSPRQQPAGVPPPPTSLISPFLAPSLPPSLLRRLFFCLQTRGKFETARNPPVILPQTTRSYREGSVPRVLTPSLLTRKLLVSGGKSAGGPGEAFTGVKRLELDGLKLLACGETGRMKGSESNAAWVIVFSDRQQSACSTTVIRSPLN